MQNARHSSCRRLRQRFENELYADANVLGELDVGVFRLRIDLLGRVDAGIADREVSGRAVDDAAEMLARGDETDPVTAYERAVMNLEDEGPVRYAYEPNEKPSFTVLLGVAALVGYDGAEGGGVVPGGVASASAARALPT